ncbi:hypothetical protein NQZ68_036614 [Dissostichus eleginoides]|nr:hypothetical protein NQZ68_036614 [Dissostichus eleginoides]
MAEGGRTSPEFSRSPSKGSNICQGNICQGNICQDLNGIKKAPPGGSRGGPKPDVLYNLSSVLRVLPGVS